MNEPNGESQARKELAELIDRLELAGEEQDAAAHDLAVAQVEELDAEDQRRVFDQLHPEQRTDLLRSLDSEAAAELLEHLAEPQAVEALALLAPGEGAAILEELPEELSGQLLREIHGEDAAAIIHEMSTPEMEQGLRERVEYHDWSAGDLMSSRVLSFPEEASVGTVLQELGRHEDDYEDMDVQYVYVSGADGKLTGVLPLRELVLARRSRSVKDIMISSPVSVGTDADLEELSHLFEEKAYLGIPVVDGNGVLKGVLTRSTLQEARAENQMGDYLKASGIVTGEELRSMPLKTRCTRRLAWLVPNIVLNLLAASIIAMYEDTLQQVIALAVFLPIVSDMSGCSGNQAVAVSIRELSLGILRTGDFFRIVLKEGALGIVNGTLLGILLGTVAGLWKANLALGLVVGSALALNTMLSVLLGGLVPLVLRRFKADPALASGPLLTTCTDMFGFFLVLTLATMGLEYLV